MKLKKIQSNFLAGVLDQRASSRVETEAYANGLLIGTNVIAQHLGGVKRRPGTRFLERLSYQLTFNTPTAATAPNGGTAANGYDGDAETYVDAVNIGTTNPFVVLRYDMGATISPRHIDINRIFLTGGTSSEFALQYSVNDTTYVTVSSFYLDTTERSYRFTPLTGAVPIPARYWRIARIGATDLGTNDVSVAEFNIWTETATVSAVRLIPFELSTSEQYLVALTDRSGFIYQDGELIPGGYFSTPYESADLADIDAAVGANTLFLVHEDFEPRYVVKSLNGVLGYNDFQTDVVAFASVPQYDFADDDSPTPTSEVQVITFSAGWIAGDSFQIDLDSARTGPIAYAGDSSAAEQAATAANIATAVQKLYTVPGFEGVTCARTGALAYTLTFAGASAKAYGLMAVLPLITGGTATATATVTRTTPGVSRHENAWSATRGYPRTVAFFEGRLFFGGTRDLPQSLLGSAVNVITEFEILEGLDADPIFVTLNGGALNAITGMYSGSNLEVFTTGGEFRYVKQPGDPITPSDIPKRQTGYGSAKVRPVSVDGLTTYVHRTRKSIRDFKFDYNEDKFNSFSLTSLAPRLINGIVDIASWHGSPTDEINLVYIVNSDGTMAVVNVRREAEVNALTRWITGPNAVEADNGTVTGQDKIRAVAALLDDVYFATERTIDGTAVVYLEVSDPDMRVDAGVLKNYNVFGVGNDYTVPFDAASPLLGAVCRVTVDGLVVDDVTPAEGSVSVPMPASYEVDTVSTEIRIGLNFNPTVRPMPPMPAGLSGQSLIRKQRLVKIKAKVFETLGLLVNGRVLADRNYDINNFDEAATPFTGNLTIEETSNYDEAKDKNVTFTQVDPLPMELLGYEAIIESSE